jgi:hypothetical protein
MGALGQVLTIDESHYGGFRQTYMVTTPADVLAHRLVEVAPGQRADQQLDALVTGTVEELSWYFGYSLTPEAAQAQMREVRESLVLG